MFQQPGALSRVVPGVLATLLLWGAVSGCASTIALSQSERAALRSVSVNAAVIVPDEVVYQGPTQGVLGAFGLIGAVAGQAAASGPKETLKAFQKEKKIDIGAIVLEEFSNQVNRNGLFPQVAPAGGDAEFKLEVRVYGLWQKHGFSSDLKPMLGVNAQLVRRGGEVVWQKYEYVSALNGETPSHTFEDYLKNPEWLRAAYAKAAGVVVSGLVQHLQQQ